MRILMPLILFLSLGFSAQSEERERYQGFQYFGNLGMIYSMTCSELRESVRYCNGLIATRDRILQGSECIYVAHARTLLRSKKCKN